MMNNQSIYKASFLVGMRQWRVTAIVYFVQLYIAFTIGLQVHSVMEASIGNSLEINKLLLHYDHTVITDFLKVHGVSITPLIGQLRYLMLFGLVFTVFINAGMLFSVSSKERSVQRSARAFWQGGVQYFFPFLKIAMVFLLLALLWTMVVFLPIALFLQPSLSYFSSEQYSVWMVIFLVLVYLFGILILFIWSVLSRAIKIETEASIAACLKNAWQVFRKNKYRFLGLMLGLVGLQIVLVAVYWPLEAFIGMTSPTGILVLFVLQQAFVFFRIQVRQMIYAGVCTLAVPLNNAPSHGL